MSSMSVSNLTIDMLTKMFAEGKRFDGRKLTDHRPVKIEYDVSNKSEGSARVKLGKTEVIVGIKMTVGTPYPDSPEKGNLSVSGDLLPLASPRFESGPPKFGAVELPRLVDRAIRESGMIELDKLAITPGEKVWTVMVDIYPINDDGNLIDAATIGAVAALKKAKIPVLDKDGKIDYYTPSKEALPLKKGTYPFSFSFFKLGDALIMDPTREEEEACDVRITWGISQWGKDYMLNSCQKSGERPMTSKDIEQMMKILPEKYDELNESLKKFF